MDIVFVYDIDVYDNIYSRVDEVSESADCRSQQW